MPRRNPFDEADRKLLISIVADGGSRADAARELGVSIHAIKRHAPAHVRFPKGKKAIPERRSAVLSLVEAGVNRTSEIARQMGLRKQTVLDWIWELEEAGLLRIVRRHRYSTLELTEPWDDREELCRRKKCTTSSRRPASRPRQP
jgi:transposase